MFDLVHAFMVGIVMHFGVLNRVSMGIKRQVVVQVMSGFMMVVLVQLLDVVFVVSIVVVSKLNSVCMLMVCALVSDLFEMRGIVENNIVALFVVSIFDRGFQVLIAIVAVVMAA